MLIWLREIRLALRSLLRARTFTVIAVATLALGVGSATAIFSVVNTVVLQSSYAESERLFAVEEIVPKLAEQYPSDALPVNAHHFSDWRKACTVCAGMGLFQGGSGANLTGDGSPERVRILGVSHDLLPTLGVTPALGRAILPSDDEPDTPMVVLLTDAFWRRRFQADPAIVGGDIRLNGRPVLVIGVLPPDFKPIAGDYLSDFGIGLQGEYQAVAPARVRYQAFRPFGNFNYGAVVRLLPGATPQQAEQQMSAALQGYSEQFNFDMSVRLRSLDAAILGAAATGWWMLLAAVGVILLIVCVNLGNLMLVRAERRRREAAVRRALGATSVRLVRQMLTEGLVLSAVGGAGGFLLAYWFVEAVALGAPPDTPRIGAVRLDWAAFGFAMATTAAAGALTSIGAAFRFGGVSLQGVLRDSQRTATGSAERVRTRGLLVAGEVALSAVLLVGAGLVGTSFFRLMSVERGFETENVLSFDLVLPPQAYPYDKGSRGQFHDKLLKELAALPGVREAGLTTRIPLEGAVWIDRIAPAGVSRPMEENLATNFRFVSGGYWRAMGVRLLAGRFLGPGDRDRKTAVISADAARKVWPGESAIGRLFTGGPGDAEPWEVVGVVADVRTTGLAESVVPIAYVSYWLRPLDAVSYAVRTAADPAALTATLREAVWEVDPALPLTNIRTMEQVVARSVSQKQFQTALVSLFSLAALALAALGIYGVVSYVVTCRTSEIGLRMALGAESSHVLQLVVRQAMRPVFAGLAVGLGAAVLLGRFVESLLFGITPLDPGVLLASGALLTAVALFACYLPARRAAALDPTAALRSE